MFYFCHKGTKLLLKLKKYICQSNIPTSFCSHQDSIINDTLEAQEYVDN